MNLKFRLIRLTVVILVFAGQIYAQNNYPLSYGVFKINKIWIGVPNGGAGGSFNYGNEIHFPNDYDILNYTAGNDNYNATGFRLGCKNWRAPQYYIRDANGNRVKDTILSAITFGATVNDTMANGYSRIQLTSDRIIRYPIMGVTGKTKLELGNYVSNTSNDTKDQLLQSLIRAPIPGTADAELRAMNKNLLGVEVNRRVIGWTNSMNDNYLIIEVVLKNVGAYASVPSNPTNTTPDTLKNFYFWMAQSVSNLARSQGSNPTPPARELSYSNVWQHYYGARPSDSLRIFYYYHADDPNRSGDNMGMPLTSQKGRLLNPNFTFYAILHASKRSYAQGSNIYATLAADSNDFSQPRVTYIGNETIIPKPQAGDDPLGNNNYWAMRGGFSKNYRMPGSDTSAYHMFNNDETGSPSFYSFPGGVYGNNQTRNMCAFGPYNFLPNQCIRIVYAVGIAGIGAKTALEIGKLWQKGQLYNEPQNMPDPEKGWLPAGFTFPTDATPMDKRKDRWISAGIDSMHATVSRAKWAFTHGYNIPPSPPPLDSLYYTPKPRVVEIHWSCYKADTSKYFAGYRIMRRLSNLDSVLYHEVYSSSKDDTARTHTFVDTTATMFSKIYYYVQAKFLIDSLDMSAHPSMRGKIMYGSRAMIRTGDDLSVNVIGPSSDEMSKIRIVPNPFNLNDPLLRTRLGSSNARILYFVYLPQIVKISIYTENGDLVQTLNHDGTANESGSFPWNLTTSNQQTVNSGVYIAVFQKPTGETSYQKFIIVR